MGCSKVKRAERLGEAEVLAKDNSSRGLDQDRIRASKERIVIPGSEKKVLSVE